MKVSMVRFSQATGYDYDLVRRIVRQHGTWKSFNEVAMSDKGLRLRFGFNGFTDYDENYNFVKKHMVEIRNCIESNIIDSSKNAVHKKIREVLHSDHSNLSGSDHINLLCSPHDRYKKWYTRPIWVIIEDMAAKLKVLNGG